MFCMSGDNISLSDSACLGPIDPQVFIGGKLVPAQAHLTAWNNLVKKTSLSEAEAIMVRSFFNPPELEFCRQASEFSIKLITEWLIKYKFKDWKTTESSNNEVTEKKKEERAEKIATELDNSKKWKLHSYPLNIEELRNMELRINRIDDDENLLRELNDLVSLVQDTKNLRKIEKLVFINYGKSNGK